MATSTEQPAPSVSVVIPVHSEDILGAKWDSCLADTTVKMGGGLALGAMFSLVLFKRRTWPMIFGVGAGLGMGCSNCQTQLNVAFRPVTLKK